VSDIDTLCGGPTAMQVVHVISQPATAWDPSSSYCIVWTGSSRGTGRDGPVLMNAPGYQCGAALLSAFDAQAVHPGTNAVVVYDTLQNCAPLYPGTRLTYPALLDFSSLSGHQPPLYACLTENAGA
jgi:hypothetical protein